MKKDTITFYVEKRKDIVTRIGKGNVNIPVKKDRRERK